MTISARPATALDEPFLRDLIVSHIAAELGAFSWPEPMRTHLPRIQHDARRQSIAAGFPTAAEHVVLIDGEPAGWMVVAEVEGEVRLVEIMIASFYRGRGVGTELIRGILARAAEDRKPVCLSVEAMNTGAIRLYERLGFKPVGGDEVRLQMNWRSDGDGSMPDAAVPVRL
jgi:ribosomal protein S18 acetylase RimI-like enzyme